jgi:hypothetical protein
MASARRIPRTRTSPSTKRPKPLLATSALASSLVLACAMGTGCAASDETQARPGAGGAGASAMAGNGGMTNVAGTGGAGTGGTEGDSQAPVILSFGTNTSSVTEGGSVTFTAVVTDPDGIDDLIGGTLKSADGVTAYGAFATSAQEGAYALTLTWQTVDQARGIQFIGEEERTFVAEFYDVAGHTAAAQIAVRLFCDTGAACEGTCVDVTTDSAHCGGCGNPCPARGGCSSGSCYEWSGCSELNTTCNDVCAAEGRTCASVCIGYEPSAPRAMRQYMELATCTATPDSGANVAFARYCDDPLYSSVYHFWVVEQCCCSIP